MKSRIIFFIFIIIIASCAKSKPTKKDVEFAIEKDNLSSFKELKENINIDSLQFELGGTALHYAIHNHSRKIAAYLIDKNFKLNAKDSFAFTPALTAIHISEQELANLLVEKPIDLNALEDYNGYTILHYAVYNNDIDLVKKLLKKGADPNIKSGSIMKDTPLHLAIDKEFSEVAAILKDKVSDTIKNINEHTVIDLALRSKNITIKKMFYDKMKIEDKKALFVNTVRTSEDLTFLNKLLDENWVTKKLINESFIFSKDTIVAEALLKKGASINYKHPDYDYGAIHYAAMRGNVEMLEFLLAKGAKINQLSKKGTLTPLMHAARLYQSFNRLNKNKLGLQINMKSIFYDQWGMSKEKTKENSLAAVTFLINNKAKTTFKNRDNENVLYYAESTHNTDVATYLKELGVQVTKKYTESKSSRFSRILNN